MRLQATLTRPQADFFVSEAKYPAFVGGFGSGKSETLAQRAIADAAHSASALIGIYAPTYDLLKLVNVTRIELKLHEHGIRHKWHSQDKAVYTSHPGFGDFIFRTMDTPERIVGYETFRAHADELDTLKTEHARTAWNQIIARNRQVLKDRPDALNRASAYTTPEGFRFTHDRWVVNATPDYRIYRAPTYSNPFLPADYIDGLRSSYPAQLIEAYIEGQFVNLTSGTVYSSYDRVRCETGETIREGEQLYIGQDFNVGQMFSAICVRRVDGFHAVQELAGVLDTPELIRVLRERFAGHPIRIYPDASGKSRKTLDASRSDLILLKEAGFKVVVNPSNPAVRDRIVSVNHAFESARLHVNSRTCPTLSAALEQQAYNPKTGEPDKESGFDHPCDAIGYLAVKEMPVRRPKREASTVQPPAEPPDYRRREVEHDEDAWKVL